MSILLGKGLTIKDFIEIEHALNSRGWDNRLGPKPDGFDAMPNWDDNGGASKDTIIGPIITELSPLVSPYERLRYHNVEVRKKMTADEFDAWFAERFFQPARLQKRITPAWCPLQLAVICLSLIALAAAVVALLRAL